MDAEYRISETRQLKAVSNPVRMRMLEALIAAPHTATQLGAALNMAASRAHYHLKQLEAAGLCRLVEQREQSGILEKYYRAVAVRFHIDRTLALDDAVPDAPESGPADVQSLISPAVRGYLERRPAPAAAAPAGDEAVLQDRIFYLSPQRYARLVGRLRALLLEFDSDIHEDRPGLKPYRLFFVAYPEATAAPAGDAAEPPR